MKTIVLLLMLSGQFSFAADEDVNPSCEARLQGHSLTKLIHEVSQGDFRSTVHANLRLHVNSLTPSELSGILALGRSRTGRANITLKEVSPGGEFLNFDFEVSGTARQVLLVLSDLADPEEMKRITYLEPKWSVLGEASWQASQPKADDPMILPIAELEIPLAAKIAFNGTRRYRYVGDLVVLSDKEILAVRGIGRDLLREIKLGLAGAGLSLSMDVPDWPERRRELLSRLEQISRDAFRIPISTLEFSVRTRNALRNDNIWFVGDLAVQDEFRVGRIPNISRKSIAEIKEKLATLGLHLGMEPFGWPFEDLPLVSN